IPTTRPLTTPPGLTVRRLSSNIASNSVAPPVFAPDVSSSFSAMNQNSDLLIWSRLSYFSDHLLGHRVSLQRRRINHHSAFGTAQRCQIALTIPLVSLFHFRERF